MKTSTYSYLSKNINIFVVFFLTIFLTLNITASQFISPIYHGMINEQKKSVVEYLKKILPFPFYKNELLAYQKFYGKELENEVLREKIARDALINKLEQLLEKNPKERDVLYSLYLLNKESGDDKKAYEYLSRSKEVDPNINKSK